MKPCSTWFPTILLLVSKDNDFKNPGMRSPSFLRSTQRMSCLTSVLVRNPSTGGPIEVNISLSKSWRSYVATRGKSDCSLSSFNKKLWRLERRDIFHAWVRSKKTLLQSCSVELPRSFASRCVIAAGWHMCTSFKQKLFQSCSGQAILRPSPLADSRSVVPHGCMKVV